MIGLEAPIANFAQLPSYSGVEEPHAWLSPQDLLAETLSSSGITGALRNLSFCKRPNCLNKNLKKLLICLQLLKTFFSVLKFSEDLRLLTPNQEFSPGSFFLFLLNANEFSLLVSTHLTGHDCYVSRIKEVLPLKQNSENFFCQKYQSVSLF